MSIKFPKVIFFIGGTNPTFDEEIAAAKLAPCRVVFRNAKYADVNGALENADAWFGEHTPAAYRKEYPEAEEAMKKCMADYEAKAEAKIEAQAKMQAKQAASAEQVTKAEAAAADKIAAAAIEKAAEKTNAAKEAKANAKKAQEAAKEPEKATTGEATKAAAKAAAGWAPNSGE